jgi:hypothetical protein
MSSLLAFNRVYRLKLVSLSVPEFSWLKANVVPAPLTVLLEILSVTHVGIFEPELVFVNVYGAQESIPRNQLRQPM